MECVQVHSHHLDTTTLVWEASASEIGIDPMAFPAAIEVAGEMLDGRVALMSDDETRADVVGYLYYSDDPWRPRVVKVFR